MGMYVYNGVELPELPDWDHEKYPYTLIHDYRQRGQYYLHAMTGPLHFQAPFYLQNRTGVPVKYACWWWEGSDAKWTPIETAEVTLTVNNSLATAYAVWANYDILNEDGSLHLAKSTYGEEDAPTVYLGDSAGAARLVTGICIGDGDGIAQKVRKAYVGDESGRAVCWWGRTGSTV